MISMNHELPLVFGPIADLYDEARPGYPTALVDAILDYADAPAAAVEVGAGTGKGTEAFVDRGLALTCVEPDPVMAAVHRRRFGDVAHVQTVVSRFEQWTPPPSGMPLVMSPMSWHWLDPVTRCALAHRALSAGGALAIFGHRYGFDDPELKAELDRGYAELAPELRAGSTTPKVTTEGSPDEIQASGLFTDVRVDRFAGAVSYPTDRYVRLLNTFSPHLLLPTPRRRALHARLAEIIDDRGGTVTVALDTTLLLARRP
jgi:hypothetical protein